MTAVRPAPPPSALQWGHVVVDVEGQLPYGRGGKTIGLQWGHVVVDVEG